MNGRPIVSEGEDRLADASLAARDDAWMELVASFAADVEGRVLDAGCGAGDPVTPDSSRTATRSWASTFPASSSSASASTSPRHGRFVAT